MSTTCRGSSDCNAGCCDDKKPAAASNHTLRLAVVRENGEVVIFDASGVPRTFTYNGNAGTLCFSTHGNGAVDDLLSHCFDEDGNHGVPDESCFCGIDTPHLHAHLHNPKTCNDDNEKKNAQGEIDLQYLAQLTLHPTDNDEEFQQEEALVNMAVSESLPNQCNSEEMARHMSQQGFIRQRRRRMHKIRHDDHVDYLVINETTGALTLEHPCDDCGDDDVHGQFHLVGKRRLAGNAQLHFFQVAPNPFSIINHLSGLFSLFDPNTADRVIAARPGTEQGDEHVLDSHSRATLDSPARKKSCCDGGTCSDATALLDDFSDFDQGVRNTVRSTFSCLDICCASEIPVITNIVEPLPGVEKVLINIPTKTVIVIHDPSVASAKQINQVLHSHGIFASIAVDGALSQASGPSTEGRSQFFVKKICCASEIPAIKSITSPMPGVRKVSINTTTKMVYVDHDTELSSASEIADALNAEHFGAQVRHDAAKDVRAQLSTFVRSTLSLEGSNTSNPDTESLKEFLGSFDPSQLEAFVVDVPSKKIHVVHNPHLLTVEAIVQKLAGDTGVEATVLVNGAESANWDFPDFEEALERLDEVATRPSIPTILSGVFWVISMLSLIGGNWEYLKWAALVSVACGLPSIGIKAFSTLRRLQFDANVLMFSAAVGALALQEFTEAAAVTFLFSISEWLEVRATTRARSALSEIVHLRPDRANLIHPITKEVMLVPASVVPVGSLVSVRTGDKIPCDGVVKEGNGTVDESSLTGESRPVRKGGKDAVSGGTINSGSTELIVRTTSTAENSAVARLIRLVEDAQANRSPTEKLVDAFAKRYTPLVLLAAICMCSIPWAFGSDVGRQWTYNGLVLIVVACPCALIISTPVTYVAGLAATAQRGVLVKGGAHLEALGGVKKIAFDKTGTLTMGEFALLHLNTFSSQYNRDEILQRLSLMEERASHPLAQAIVQAAQNENVSIPKGMKAKDHTQLPGEGIVAEIDDKIVYVGNVRLFRRLGLLDQLPPEQWHSAEEWASSGGTVGFMSIEGCGIVCSYCVADAVRPESALVVASLRDHDIDAIMLTGDNSTAANAIGRQVGLNEDQVKSNLLPEDKLTLVNEFKEEPSTRRSYCGTGNACQSRRLVAMCGDGVNDAPALAAADVGVAMGAGAALAMETSDVTLLDSELDKLVYCLRMGRRVIRKIRENVIFSLVTKAIVVGFAIAGHAQLWAAIAADVGAMLIVTLNGMLLLPRRKKDTSSRVVTESSLDDPEGVSREPCASAEDSSGNAKSPVAEDSPLPTASCCKKNDTGCCGSSSAKENVMTVVDRKVAAVKGDSTGCCSGGNCGSSSAKENATSAVDTKVAGASSCCMKETSSCCSGDKPLANKPAAQTLSAPCCKEKSSCCDGPKHNV